MIFKSRKPKISRNQQLGARPIRVDAKMEEREDGGAKLKVRVKAKRWAAWLVGTPDEQTKTFELDPVGLMVWKACDGKTTVQQIIRRLSKSYRLTLREAEVSCTTFLSTLLRKGLIGMAIEEEDKSGKAKKKA